MGMMKVMSRREDKWAVVVWKIYYLGERRGTINLSSIFLVTHTDLVGLMRERGCWKPLKLDGGVVNSIGHLWVCFVLIWLKEGVESFKDFSFLSDPIGEVGVIIYALKNHWHSKLYLHSSAYTPTSLMTMSSFFTSHRLS